MVSVNYPIPFFFKYSVKIYYLQVCEKHKTFVINEKKREFLVFPYIPQYVFLFEIPSII